MLPNKGTDMESFKQALVGTLKRANSKISGALRYERV